MTSAGWRACTAQLGSQRATCSHATAGSAGEWAAVHCALFDRRVSSHLTALSSVGLRVTCMPHLTVVCNTPSGLQHTAQACCTLSALPLLSEWVLHNGINTACRADGCYLQKSSSHTTRSPDRPRFEVLHSIVEYAQRYCKVQHRRAILERRWKALQVGESLRGMHTVRWRTGAGHRPGGLITPGVHSIPTVCSSLAPDVAVAGLEHDIAELEVSMAHALQFRCVVVAHVLLWVKRC